MKFHDIKKELEGMLSKKRFVHSLGVSAAARHLAELYGGDADQAELAGLVHDCAKEMKLPEMQAWAAQKAFPIDDYMWQSRALLHGPAGSAYAELHFGITDPEILSAVYYHTTGKAGMSLLEEIVFLADYIEPSRDFPGVDELRKKAEKNLDDAALFAYDSTLRHLLEEHAYVYELTLSGRNALLQKIQKKEGKA